MDDLFGLLGSGMVKTGLFPAPLVLGIVLGDPIEANPIRALMTDGNPWPFLARPIPGTMPALAVASCVLAQDQQRRADRRAQAQRRQEDDPSF